MISNRVFQIGDRVVAVKEVDGNAHCIGMCGTVADFSESVVDGVLVDFDKSFVGGHTGSRNYKSKNKSCRWGKEEDFDFEFQTIDVKDIEVKVSYDELLV